MASAPQKRLSRPLCHTRAGLPEPSICISVLPPGKPQRPPDPDSARAPDFPPRDPTRLGSPGRHPPPHGCPIPSLPRRKPVPSPVSLPVQFGSRGRAGTRLPPPDPQRRALTELLCRPGDSGSAPARCGRGSGLALRPRGRARAQSAAPSLLPQLRWGPRPPRLRPLSRPRRPAAALPGQRRATVT